MCDRFSMINSVEMRLPYLDHEFIEKTSNYIYDNYFYKNFKISKKPVRDLMLKHCKYKFNWINEKNHNPTPQDECRGDRSAGGPLPSLRAAPPRPERQTDPTAPLRNQQIH